MTFRLGAHLTISRGLAGAITDTLELGGNCLQIFSSPPRNWSKPRFTISETNNFKQLTRRHHISPVFIHAKYLINISSSDEHLRQKSIDSLLTDLTFASQIGSQGVIFHPRLDPFSKPSGTPVIQSAAKNPVRNQQPTGDSSSPSTSRSGGVLRMTNKNYLLLQSLRVILDSLDKSRHSELVSESQGRTPDQVQNGHGVEPPNLILENPAQTRLPDLGFILKTLSHPQLKFCLDLAHAYEAGYDLTTSRGLTVLFQEIEHFIAYENLVCIHANDSLTTLSSHHDRHANIGQGHLGPHPFFIFLNHTNTKDLPFILETPAIKTERISGQKKNLQKLIQLHGVRLPRSFFHRLSPHHSERSLSTDKPHKIPAKNLSDKNTHRAETTSTLAIARELLGKYLIVDLTSTIHPSTPGDGPKSLKTKGSSTPGVKSPFLVARITETEAYIGTQDLACHASKGKTKRTAIMWDSPGKLYVYLIYGMYHCLNIITERRGFPAAVLIRGAEPVFGFPPGTQLNGPGKLCRAFGFTRYHTGTDITKSHQIYLKDITRSVSGSGLESPLRPAPKRGNKGLSPLTVPKITTTSRIGVAYAGPWAAKPWRFVLKS
jgi:DNA-3-methyladenine glycosylase